MSTTHQQSPQAPTAAVDLARERTRIEEVLRRILSDLAMITDRDLALEGIAVETAPEPLALEGGVHIAFKLALRCGGVVRRGCLQVPLPDAISIACYLMMVTDEGVSAKRGLETLDETLKDSLLEVGNFVAGAAGGALRDTLREDTEVRTEGCQGLRSGASPALAGPPGQAFVVGRARATLQGFPTFSLLLQLPLFP